MGLIREIVHERNMKMHENGKTNWFTWQLQFQNFQRALPWYQRRYWVLHLRQQQSCNELCSLSVCRPGSSIPVYGHGICHQSQLLLIFCWNLEWPHHCGQPGMPIFSLSKCIVPIMRKMGWEEEVLGKIQDIPWLAAVLWEDVLSKRCQENLAKFI